MSDAVQNDRVGTSALNRTIVLVGLMGAGKSCIGRKLAHRLGVSFVDADTEIEQAAGCSIAEIFERYGEPYFRDGERRVMTRLLHGAPAILAAGGGAFMDPDTRALIRDMAVSVWLKADLDTLSQRTRGRTHRPIRDMAVSVWLKADLDTLSQRTRGRTHRPLLNGNDSREVLARLIEVRYPVYAQANIIVETGNDNPTVTCVRVLEAVEEFLGTALTTQKD
jgi:shikimate kinase